MSFGRVNQQWTSFSRMWHVINAFQQPPGKVADLAAKYVSGRHKPLQCYSSDGVLGDHVVVVNSRHISFSGNKWEEKQFRSSTGRTQGVMGLAAWECHKLDPTWVMRRMTYRALSYDRERRRNVFNRLHVFADEDIPEEIRENISNVIEAPRRLYKRLEDYTEEEVAEFPQLWIPGHDFVNR